MMRSILLTAIALTSLVSYARAAEPATQPAPGIPGQPPIILLKLDDVGAWVSPRWERVVGFLQDRKIHANLGVIGESLPKPNNDAIKWMQDLHASGQFEIWCHGWHLRSVSEKAGEWESGTADEQTAVLQKCEDAAKEKLGFPLQAFGPHWSGTTAATDEAMSRIPEMKVWLYAPPDLKFFKGLAIPRFMGLEDPTFVPDADKFQKHYNGKGHLQSVLVLQGHPDQWTTDARWEGFVKIIDFLQSQNCQFMTITEYLAQLNK